jgi:spore maturation protein CgeB
MLTIVYSYNKAGFEAEFWEREIAAASDHEFRFVPFNHGRYINPYRHIRAQLLDNLYYERDPELATLYSAFEATLRETSADALIVDTCPPYHPDYLRNFGLYKVLRTADGPLAAYDRDIPYVHAYDHILFHSPAYSRDMGMEEKLAYCGARRATFWPLALFDAGFDPSVDQETLFSRPRDIDVIFIGALHPNKMPLLAKVKKAFGSRCVMHGLTSLKKNLYFNAKFGFPGWIRPIAAQSYVSLYQRSRIGFNLHNRGDYTVGSFRLFELPANGVMQISDGGPYLDSFFEVGDEIIGHRGGDDLIDLIRYYLAHDDERLRIARNGYQRVIATHRIAPRLREAGRIIRAGMSAARVRIHG